MEDIDPFANFDPLHSPIMGPPALHGLVRRARTLLAALSDQEITKAAAYARRRVLYFYRQLYERAVERGSSPEAGHEFVHQLELDIPGHVALSLDLAMYPPDPNAFENLKEEHFQAALGLSMVAKIQPHMEDDNRMAELTETLMNVAMTIEQAFFVANTDSAEIRNLYDEELERKLQEFLRRSRKENASKAGIGKGTKYVSIRKDAFGKYLEICQSHAFAPKGAAGVIKDTLFPDVIGERQKPPRESGIKSWILIWESMKEILDSPRCARMSVALAAEFVQKKVFIEPNKSRWELTEIEIYVTELRQLIKPANR